MTHIFLNKKIVKFYNKYYKIMPNNNMDFLMTKKKNNYQRYQLMKKYISISTKQKLTNNYNKLN